MAKTNWAAHAQAFIDRGNESKPARDAYCLEHDINPNSFRRELNKYKSANSNPDQKIVISKKADQSPRRKPDQTKSKKVDKKQNDKTNPKAERLLSGGGCSESDQEAGTTRARGRVANDVPANVTRDDGTRCFAKGNKASLLHGRYANKLLTREEYFDYAEASLEDVHRVMKSRFFGMQQISTTLIDQVIEDYGNGRAHVKEVFEGGDLVQIPMSFEEAITSAQLTGLKEFTKLGESIMKAEQNMQQLMIDAHKLSPISQAEAIERTAELLKERNEKKLSAAETCLLFSENGIKAPPILLEEAKQEIKLREPEVDDNAGGLSQEQVDAAHAASVKQRAVRDEEVSAHKANISRLIKKHADEGKMKVIGGDGNE